MFAKFSSFYFTSCAILICSGREIKNSKIQNNESANPLALSQIEIQCKQDQVFHNETGSCYYPSNSPITYTRNVSSPCGQLMSFYKASAKFGTCGCITDDGCRFSVDFNRPILNWPGENRCYFAYQRGPCKAEEWLILNPKTFQSECRPNSCLHKKFEEPSKKILSLPWPETKDIDIFIFIKNGTCYQTFTQAFCPKDYHVRFLRTSNVPFCAENQFSGGCGSVGSTAGLPCPQGHKRVGNECTPEADFQ